MTIAHPRRMAQSNRDTMPRRLCLDCPRVTPPGAKRCAEHQRAHQHQRDQRGYNDPTYRRRRKAFVDAWIATHGLLCPGLASLGHTPHVVPTRRDLTIDHITPLTQGGALTDPANFRILCRQANSGRAGR